MNKQILISDPLPYTMGNCGDLIKHGLLAEFVSWSVQNISQTLTFYDPFGGRPWQFPVDPEVTKRIAALENCALKVSQDDSDVYYGSGHIVKNLNSYLSAQIKVLTSDRDSHAQEDLINNGLSLITLAGFEPKDAYSVLTASRDKNEKALILIDPFYELEHINQTVLSEIRNTVVATSASVILYVLYDDKENEHWIQFQHLNKSLVMEGIRTISLGCPAIDKSPIKGESKLHSYVVLYVSNHCSGDSLELLRKKVSTYAENLEGVIECPIDSESKNIPQEKIPG